MVRNAQGLCSEGDTRSASMFTAFGKQALHTILNCKFQLVKIKVPSSSRLNDALYHELSISPLQLYKDKVRASESLKNDFSAQLQERVYAKSSYHISHLHIISGHSAASDKHLHKTWHWTQVCEMPLDVPCTQEAHLWHLSTRLLGIYRGHWAPPKSWDSFSNVVMCKVKSMHWLDPRGIFAHPFLHVMALRSE